MCREPLRAGLGFAAGLAVVSLLAGFFWRQRAQQGERENQAMLQLRLAAAERLTVKPRKAGWSGRAAERLAAAGVLKEEPFFRDQAVATLEGLDATLLINQSTAPRTNRQIAFDATGEAVVLAGETNAEVWRLAGTNTPGNTNAVALPGRLLALPANALLQVALAESGRLFVWQPVERRKLCDLETPPKLPPIAEGLFPSAISRRGNRLALGWPQPDRLHGLALWELPSGRWIRTIPIGEELSALALSDDGALAATGDSAGTVKVWDVATGEAGQAFGFFRGAACGLAFGESVRRFADLSTAGPPWLLAAGNDAGVVRVWDLADRSEKPVCRGGQYAMTALAFSPDHATLAGGGRAQSYLWDVATGTQLLELDTGDRAVAFVFGVDGRHLATCGGGIADGPWLQVYRLEDGRGITSLRGLSGSVTKLALSPAGGRLAAVSLNWEVAVWDARTGHLLHLFDAPRGGTADNFGLAFSPDGLRLALAAGNEAQLWDLSTGRRIKSWPLPEGYADTLTFPAADRLFLFRADHEPDGRTVCRLRNLLSPQPLAAIRELRDFDRRVFETVASADGRFIAVEGKGNVGGRERRSILALETATGRTIWDMPSTNAANFAALRFSTTGAKLGFLHRHQPTDFRLVDFNAPAAEPRPLPYGALAFGPDATRWAADASQTGAGRGVTLIENGKPVLNLGFDSDFTLATAFDETGQFLALGNKDGTVTVCDLEQMLRHLAEAKLR